MSDFVFGELLRQFRVREGLTQEQLADAVGFARQTISNWEKGNTKPRRAAIDLLIESEALFLNGIEKNDLLIAAGYSPKLLQESINLSSKESDRVLQATQQREASQTNIVSIANEKIFMAPEMPKVFVPRDQEYELLISSLLARDNKGTIAITTSLLGAGGYGKTTLAAAVCHDERIKKAFPDGILWIELGPNSKNLVEKVDDLIQALTGNRSDYFSIIMAEAELRRAWGERECLLVIDDVWDQTHLDPFLQKGQNYSLLITSRVRSALPEDSTPIPIDAMQEDEATILISAGLPDGEMHSLMLLASRIGRWPLLLKIINSALHEKVKLGYSLNDAVNLINKDLTDLGLAHFDKPVLNAANSRERNQAVEASVSVGIAQLQKNAPYGLIKVNERARYQELAIFPENADIPLYALKHLWEATGHLSNTGVRRLCERMAGLSLLLDYNTVTQTIRLHDVIQQYLVQVQSDNLSSLHGQLVNYYQGAYESRWSECDEYGLQYLPWHIYQSGRHEELHSLLEETSWYKAKLEIDPSRKAFDEDVNLAIQAARSQTKAGLPRIIAYSLLRAELHDKAGMVPSEFIEAMVHLGLEDQALGYTELQPNPLIQARMLYSVASYYRVSGQKEKAKRVLSRALESVKKAQWSDEDKSFALEAEWMVETESERTLSGILVRIINLMGDLGDVYGLNATILVVGGLPFRRTRRSTKIDLLVEVARNLAKAKDVPGALKLANEIAELVGPGIFPDEYKLEDTLTLKRQGLILVAEEMASVGANREAQQVLAEVWPVLGGKSRASQLVEIVRIAIRNKDFEDARQIITQIDHTDYKNQPLVWLARGMANSQQKNAAEEILKIARSLRSSGFKSYALIAATDAASRNENPEDLYALISEADTLVDRFDDAQRSWFLSRIVFYLAKRGDWKSAQDLTNQMNDLYWKIRALVVISEAAHKNSLLELALHSLENATDLLPESIVGSGYRLKQSLELRCFVARAWAMIDRRRGVTLMRVDELPDPLKIQDDEHSLEFLPVGEVSRTFAALSLFDKAEQYAKLDHRDQAESLVYLGERLIEEDNKDRAIEILLQAVKASVQKAVRWRDYSALDLYSYFDEALWTYEDAVRHILKLGGQSYFTQRRAVTWDEIMELTQLGHRHYIPLEATLEYLAKELGWVEQASLAEEGIKKSLAHLIPDPETLATLSGEELKDVREPRWHYSYFWEDLFSNWPPSWIIYRFTGLSNEEIATRLRNIEQLFRQWLSRTSFSMRSGFTNDEIEDIYKLSVFERNQLVSQLASRFAQFQLYDDALRVIGLVRISDSSEAVAPSLAPSLDVVSFARLALLSYRLGDPTSCQECLQYVLDARHRSLLRGGEEYLYAAEAAQLLGDEELITKLRDQVRSKAGIFEFRAPALATLNDTAGLRLFLSYVPRMEWGFDQVDAVVAIAKAMAMANDSKGLELIFSFAQDYNPPQTIGSWLQEWFDIVKALIDAHHQLQNYDEIVTIINWLPDSKPKDRDLKIVPTSWIIRLCAYACRLLAQTGQDEYAYLIHQTAEKLDEINQFNKLKEQDGWVRGRKNAQIVPAYLDLARAYADIQDQARAEQALDQASEIVENQWSIGHRFHALRDFALSDLTEALVNHSTIDQALSVFYEINNKDAQFSAVYSIIANMMENGDSQHATELVSQYHDKLDWSPWKDYWQLYQEITEIKLLRHTPDGWVENFLNKCTNLDGFEAASRLCTMAAKTLLTQDNPHGTGQLVKTVLDWVAGREASGQLDWWVAGREASGQIEQNVLSNLIEPIIQLGQISFLQRIARLIIDRGKLVQSGLITSTPTLETKETIDDFLNYLKNIDAPSSHDLMASLVHAFEKNNDIENLYRLVDSQFSPAPIIQSDEFHLEIGAYGTIARALFRLEGEKGLAYVIEATENLSEYWKPLLLANLARAIHAVAPQATRIQTLLEQAMAAAESLVNTLETDRYSRQEIGAPKDAREMWEDVAKSIAAIGATAAMAGMTLSAENFLNRAISLTDKGMETDRQERIVAFIAKMMVQSSRYSEGTDLALSIGGRSARNSAIEEIISVLAQRGEFIRALELKMQHTGTDQSPIFAIGNSLKKQLNMSESEKIDIIMRAFDTFSTRDSFGFWDCFKAMLSAIEQIDGDTLAHTWKQMQRAFSYTLESRY